MDEEKSLSEVIKRKLRTEKSNLTIFWKEKIKEQTNVTYGHLINMLGGRVTFREDVKKIVLDYLNGRD